jgi:hypothetical protein
MLAGGTDREMERTLFRYAAAPGVTQASESAPEPCGIRELEATASMLN